VSDTEGVTALSNIDCPVDGLKAKLEQTIRELPEGDVVVFADIFGSSCANAGLEVSRGRSRVAVLSGVNLSMVVRFLCHRHRKSFDELIPFLVETGRTAVRSVEL
jgi:mannose/fructose-specific phosphotransferase system component IIA